MKPKVSTLTNESFKALKSPKLLHDLSNAHANLNAFVEIGLEEPEYFHSEEGKKSLESLKLRHLPVLTRIMDILRKELPP